MDTITGYEPDAAIAVTSEEHGVRPHDFFDPHTRQYVQEEDSPPPYVKADPNLLLQWYELKNQGIQTTAAGSQDDFESPQDGVALENGQFSLQNQRGREPLAPETYLPDQDSGRVPVYKSEDESPQQNHFRDTWKTEENPFRDTFRPSTKRQMIQDDGTRSVNPRPSISPPPPPPQETVRELFSKNAPPGEFSQNSQQQFQGHWIPNHYPPVPNLDQFGMPTNFGAATMPMEGLQEAYASPQHFMEVSVPHTPSSTNSPPWQNMTHEQLNTRRISERKHFLMEIETLTQESHDLKNRQQQELEHHQIILDQNDAE